MTTQTQPRPSAPPPAPAPRKRSGARVAAIVAGAVLALGGLAAGGLGAGMFAFLGSDGTAQSGTHDLSTHSRALVSDVADLNGTSDVSDVLGDAKVRLSAQATGSASGLFIGIGPAKDVERYLAGTRHEEATDVDVYPWHLDREMHAGTRKPGRPGAQDFWVARATGERSASLSWKIRDGEYRAVLMNADAGSRVDADGKVALTFPHVEEVAWSLVGGGLLLIALGATAIVVGARRPS
jgi:hypothetical protein